MRDEVTRQRSQTTTFEERRAESESNRGPCTYQSNASHVRIDLFFFLFLFFNIAHSHTTSINTRTHARVHTLNSSPSTTSSYCLKTIQSLILTQTYQNRIVLNIVNNCLALSLCVLIDENLSPCYDDMSERLSNYHAECQAGDATFTVYWLAI